MASVNNTRSIRAQELRASRKALTLLSDDELRAQVRLGAHLLAPCSLLRLAGYMMRAQQVAMPSPLGERNLPNLFPDLDSLAVEFSSKLMGQLREAWSATGLHAAVVEQNAIAIGLMLPFWRVGSLLELHELGWLTKIHLCDRSPTKVDLPASSTNGTNRIKQRGRFANLCTPAGPQLCPNQPAAPTTLLPK